MAHKTKINGTAYEIKGGRTKVGGTGYDIKKGRTKVGGTGYDVEFSNLITVTLLIPKTTQELDSFYKAGTIYLKQAQTIVLQVDPSITTFEELAEASEYNTISPDSGGHTAKLSVYLWKHPSVIYTSVLTGGSVTLRKETLDVDSIAIYDGVTINLINDDGGVKSSGNGWDQWSIFNT